MLTSGAFGYLFDYLLWWVLYLSLLIHTWCFFRFFPRSRFRKAGLALGNGLVFLCLLGLAALAGESYLRFAAVETDSFGVSLPARRWFALYTKLNSLGCRDREWVVPKPPGVRRIAFVGDSFVYGWGIKRPEDRFPDRIRARFDSRAPGTVEVLNVAKPGWDTGQQVQPAEDMISLYGVDEVILCHVLNDIEDLLPQNGAFGPTKLPEPTFFNLDSSCLLDYLYRRIYVPRVASVAGYQDWLAAGYEDQAIWDKHVQRLLAMRDDCTRHGVTFRVALLPFIQTSGHRLNQRELHERLRKALEQQQVPVVDLLPSIEVLPADTLVVNQVDAHPNERTQALFAEAIWKSFYAPPGP